MNRVWPARSRSYSSSIGSLTFSSRSASAHTSSAVGHDPGAGGREVGVRDGGALPRALLDEHLVPGPHQLGHPGRGERHPVLPVLDLSGNPDPHRLDSCVWRRSPGDGSPTASWAARSGRCLGRSLGTRTTRHAGPRHGGSLPDRSGSRLDCGPAVRAGGCSDAALRPAPRPARPPAGRATSACSPGSCSGSWSRARCTARSSSSPSPAGPSRTSGNSVAGNMNSAAGVAEDVPVVGDDLAAPFDALADASGSVSGAGQAAQDAVGTLATVLAVVLVVLPVGWLLLRWLPWRLRLRARGRCRARGCSPARRTCELLAARALATAPLPRLAALPAGHRRRLAGRRPRRGARPGRPGAAPARPAAARTGRRRLRRDCALRCHACSSGR